MWEAEEHRRPREAGGMGTGEGQKRRSLRSLCSEQAPRSTAFSPSHWQTTQWDRRSFSSVCTTSKLPSRALQPVNSRNSYHLEALTTCQDAAVSAFEALGGRHWGRWYCCSNSNCPSPGVGGLYCPLPFTGTVTSDSLSLSLSGRGPSVTLAHSERYLGRQRWNQSTVNMEHEKEETSVAMV